MKFKKLITLICIFGLTITSAYAIQDKKKAPETAIVYSNDVHSVFSLNDCINIAIENNPVIRASIFNEKVYKSQIGQAWANYFPTISAGFDFSRSGNQYSHSGDKPFMYVNTYTSMGYIPTISADMLLFDFGKTKASADMAKNLYKASQEDTKENINTIIYDIKAAYFNILFAQAQIKVYEDTVLDYELQLNQAWSFYKLGKKAKIDVVTADYNLGKAKLNLVKAKNVLQVALTKLSKIMGIPEYTNYELSDELLLNSFDITSEKALEMAMEVRPELISAEKSAKAAKMNLRAKRRNFTPNLGVYGSYDNGIGNDYNLRSAKIGANLSYSAFNILRTAKQISQAKAEYERSLAELDNTKHEVYFSVKKAYIDLQTNREAIIIAKLALDQAREQYRQVTGRYKAGVGTAIELKDGENTYLNARLDFYNSVLNYDLSFANLEKEIGVPLKFSDELIIDLSQDEI